MQETGEPFVLGAASLTAAALCWFAFPNQKQRLAA
jgi:hypothetical protein